MTRWLALLALTALTALTACTPPPPPVVTPPLPAYTCAEQRQAADELEGRPMLDRMIADYATLRAQVRALRNEPEPEGCE